MNITVAAIQSRFTDDMGADIARIEGLVADAAGRGAKVVLPPELFQGHYFCRVESEEHFARAFPTEKHPAVQAMQKAAKQHGIVIPTSYFEKDGPHYYNSLAVVDADGRIVGTYRKSHIPDGPGYEEKFYFRPGNTGFRVWPTRYGTLGVGVCWDQWFPEAARAMALAGADVLFYPTAIARCRVSCRSPARAATPRSASSPRPRSAGSAPRARAARSTTWPGAAIRACATRDCAT
jgi:N-carbamoylputrescine amidase